MTIRGRVIITPTSVGSDSQPISGLALFYIPTSGAQPVIVATWSALSGFRYKTFGTAGGWATNGVGYNLGSPGAFDSYLNWLFYSDPGANQNQRTQRANQLKLDNTVSLSVTNWQANPPPGPPGTPSINNNGAIWGNGYYWRYTYSNAVLETSPSDPIGPFNVTQISPPPSGTGLAIAPPPPPVLSVTGGGSLPARTEYYVLTYYESPPNIESPPSAEVSIAVPAGQVVVVSSPPASAPATNYIIYASNNSGEEVRQPIGAVAIGTNTTMPTTGILTGSSAVMTFTASTDPQITTVNFYRIGGTLSQWLLVGSVSNGAGSFTDTSADASVVGQTLVLHRDPPAPFGAIAAHKERMFGFGYPSYTGL